MKKNNKGFSMIELVITIAIMGILTGSFVAAAGYLKYANAKAGAKKINAELSELRIDTMSKMQTPYLYLYKIDSNTYMKVVSGDDSATVGGTLDTNTTRVGNVKINVFYTDSSGEHQLGTSGSQIMIEMDKSTGAFKSGYSSIRVASSDGKRSYTIKLVKTTGKHYIQEEEKK